MTQDQELSKSRIPVIAVIDVGKTNKKIFLFDQAYKIVYERRGQLQEIVDDDGFPCEDLDALSHWVKEEMSMAQRLEGVTINAINFSAYGASFVHLDARNKPLGALYNYLKPYPNELLHSFLSRYDQHHLLSLQTASPQLGSLNSGLQLYRLKHEKPSQFKQIKYSLHLPQYISFILTEKPFTELTSIGCHTLLWDYQKKTYHEWAVKENIDSKFAALVSSDHVTQIEGKRIGAGLHDSSAALIPYFKSFHEPFVLISTGTWCISLNPFNHNALTEEELKSDCLQYLSYEGKPVKASRLFAGHEHELMLRKIADHFSVGSDYFRSVQFDQEITATLIKRDRGKNEWVNKAGLQNVGFDQRDLVDFSSFHETYHQLLLDIVRQQKKSTSLVLKNTNVKKIFVDGGFSTNSVYMNLLAAAFPNLEIYSTSVPQASALGAALAIHTSWNNHSIPSGIITLYRFPKPDGIAIQ